jgi:hypothetical protein
MEKKPADQAVGEAWDDFSVTYSDAPGSLAPALLEYDFVVDTDLAGQRHPILANPARRFHDHFAD